MSLCQSDGLLFIQRNQRAGSNSKLTDEIETRREERLILVMTFCTKDYRTALCHFQPRHSICVR